MKHLLALAAPALIALGFVGLVSAQAPPAAPTGVTVHSSGEGVLVSWDQNAAAAHWVAWMNDDEYRAARDAGDWTTALNYASVPAGDTHVVPAESLIKDDDYWFTVGSESRQTPSATSWGAWQSLTVDHAMALDDALTRAYVERAIAYYDANGLDATTARYKSGVGVEDGRQLTLLDAEESVLLVYRTLPTLEGQYVGPGSRFPGLGMLIAVATEEGHWDTIRGINAVTKQEEPRRVLVVLHDGLVFTASHSALTESTREYVRKAIAKYDEDGLEATIAHYNRQDSLEGQFYLFLIGAETTTWSIPYSRT